MPRIRLWFTLMEGKTMTETPGNPEPATETKTPQPENVSKTFTQDELNEIISKEKAKLKASYEAKAQEQAKKDAEAQELARLDGEAKLKKQWEIRERELNERATKAEHDLAVSNAKASLASKGYADVADIAPYLIGKDADETEANVSKFDVMVQKLVSEKISSNLAKGTPPDPANGVNSSLKTDEEALRKAMGL